MGLPIWHYPHDKKDDAKKEGVKNDATATARSTIRRRPSIHGRSQNNASASARRSNMRNDLVSTRGSRPQRQGLRTPAVVAPSSAPGSAPAPAPAPPIYPPPYAPAYDRPAQRRRVRESGSDAENSPSYLWRHAQRGGDRESGSDAENTTLIDTALQQTRHLARGDSDSDERADADAVLRPGFRLSLVDSHRRWRLQDAQGRNRRRGNESTFVPPALARSRPESRTGQASTATLPTPPQELSVLPTPEEIMARNSRASPFQLTDTNRRPLSPDNGLGDRRRSPSPSADFWPVMRSTINPDESLPSTGSSFTSAAVNASFGIESRPSFREPPTGPHTARLTPTSTVAPVDPALNPLANSRTDNDTVLGANDTDNTDSGSETDSMVEFDDWAALMSDTDSNASFSGSENEDRRRSDHESRRLRIYRERFFLGRRLYDAAMLTSPGRATIRDLRRARQRRARGETESGPIIFSSIAAGIIRTGTRRAYMPAAEIVPAARAEPVMTVSNLGDSERRRPEEVGNLAQRRRRARALNAFLVPRPSTRSAHMQRSHSSNSASDSSASASADDAHETDELVGIDLATAREFESSARALQQFEDSDLANHHEEIAELLGRTRAVSERLVNISHRYYGSGLRGSRRHLPPPHERRSGAAGGEQDSAPQRVGRARSVLDRVRGSRVERSGSRL